MRVPHALRINSSEGSHKGDSREMSVWLHMPPRVAWKQRDPG